MSDRGGKDNIAIVTANLLADYSSQSSVMSSNNIARRCNTTQSNIYWHYVTKEQLLSSALDYLYDCRRDEYDYVVKRESMCRSSFVHRYLAIRDRKKHIPLAASSIEPQCSAALAKAQPNKTAIQASGISSHAQA